MSKNLLNRVVNDEDIHHAALNFGIAYFAGEVANVISNSVFHFDLNRYNSVTHFALGAGIGTFTYRKAGGGAKGIVAGLAAATMFNVLWEPLENSYVWKSRDWWKSVDTISDVAMVYIGNVLSFLAEKAKGYKRKKKD